MRVITIRTNKAETEYVICESVEEVSTYYPDKTIKKINDEGVEIGDIIHSDNGFYVPLLAIRKAPGRQHKSKASWQNTSYHFPKDVVFRYKDHPIKHFNWEPTKDSQTRWLNSNKKLWCQLIKQGLSPHLAVTKVWKGADPEQKAQFLLNDDKVVDYLMNKLNYAKDMLDQLAQNGITKDSLAKEMSDLIKDKEANASLRKWALETAYKALSEEKTQIQYQDSSQRETLLIEAKKRVELKLTSNRVSQSYHSFDTSNQADQSDSQSSEA